MLKTAEPTRLLLVDDDPVSLDVFSLLLSAAGYKITTESSATSALETLHLSAAEFDVVLADMHMPDIHGGELLQRLRSLTDGQLIAMSGSYPSKGELAAADGFLLKPFEAADLANVLAGARQKASPLKAEEGRAVVLDNATFIKFRSLMRESEMANMYAVCLQDVGTRLETMREALRRNDNGEVSRIAHSIRGGCSVLGAIEMALVASLLEAHAPSSDNFGYLGKLVQDLTDAAERLRLTLNTLFPAATFHEALTKDSA